MNYNLVHSVEDISEDSGPAAEPVTLQEAKDYLRLEGFGGDSSSGLAMQSPLSLPFTSGASVLSALLQTDGAVVTTVQREGIGYSIVTGIPAGRQCVVNYGAGTITFPIASNGSETVDINYGISGAAGTVDDFDFDDTLIENLIIAGRTWCEEKTGCSLVTKLINAYVTNLSGRLQVPAGPITGTVTAINSDGDAIDAAKILLIGTKFPELKDPKQADMILSYAAGYTPSTIPKGLKQAILSYVAATYENRADDKTADLKQAAQLCGPYIKYSAWG